MSKYIYFLLFIFLLALIPIVFVFKSEPSGIIFSSLLTESQDVIEKKEETSKPLFHQPTYKTKRLDTTAFLYDGECSEPFKYKENNKRDLLFHAHYSNDLKKWKRGKQQFIDAFEIHKSGIPNATKIFVTYGEEIEEGFYEMLESYGYQIIHSDVQLKKGEQFNVAVYRFLELEKYLKEHKDEYDRVAITDVRDIYWFGDGFSTISPDEIVTMKECDDYENGTMWCRDMGRGKLSGLNTKWVMSCFGKETLDDLEQNHAYIINSGFIAGGTSKMLEFLRVYNDLLNEKKDKWNIWGIDQSALIVAVHYGKFNHLNLTLETYSQRMGNDMRGVYIYDREKKILRMRSKQCSPVIRHKVDRVGKNG